MLLSFVGCVDLSCDFKQQMYYLILFSLLNVIHLSCSRSTTNMQHIHKMHVALGSSFLHECLFLMGGNWEKAAD